MMQDQSFLVRAIREHDAIRGVYKPGQIYKATRDRTHWKIFYGARDFDYWLFESLDSGRYFERML